MLYDLLVPLARDSIVFNVFRYITFRAAMATVTAIVISFLLGPWLIARLRALQDGGEFRQHPFRGRARHPHERVQLIHRSVRLDAQRILGHTLPACQSGIPVITAARVDTVDRHPGIVESLAHFSHYRPLASVHFTPLTKFSLGAGNPKVSS